MKVLLKLKESFNEMKTVVTYTRSVYAFQEMLSRIWLLMYLLNHFNIWLNLNNIISFPIFYSKLGHNPFSTRAFRQFSKWVYQSSIESTVARYLPLVSRSAASTLLLINIYPCFYKKKLMDNWITTLMFHRYLSICISNRSYWSLISFSRFMSFNLSNLS